MLTKPKEFKAFLNLWLVHEFNILIKPKEFQWFRCGHGKAMDQHVNKTNGISMNLVCSSKPNRDLVVLDQKMFQRYEIDNFYLGMFQLFDLTNFFPNPIGEHSVLHIQRPIYR